METFVERTEANSDNKVILIACSSISTFSPEEKRTNDT